MALECLIHLVLQHQPLPEKLPLYHITTLLMSQCICYEFISQNKPIELFIAGPSNHLCSLYHWPLQLGMQRCTSIGYKCPATGSAELTYCYLDISPRTMYHQILLLTFHSAFLFTSVTLQFLPVPSQWHNPFYSNSFLLCFLLPQFLSSFPYSSATKMQMAGSSKVQYVSTN